MSRQTKLVVALAVTGLCVGIASVAGAETKDKWRVGAQSYSFNRFTFEEAMAKTKACGMKYIEVFPDQKIEWDGPNMKATNLPEVNQFLRRKYREGWTL